MKNTVAFVISAAEADIVKSLAGDNTPEMRGALFHFHPSQIPDFLDTLYLTAADLPYGSEEHRACLRLMERLGTWIGKGLVEKKKAKKERKAPSPAPKNDLAEGVPAEENDLAVDVPTPEQVD